jgi:hypothetical protein
MTTKRDQCESTRQDGGRCPAPALPERPYCFAHDPELAERREAGRRRGGRNRAKIVRLRGRVPPRLLPVYDTLEQALFEVHRGDISPQQATAMAALSRAMVSVLTAGELEQRVRDLETAAEQPLDRRQA